MLKIKYCNVCFETEVTKDEPICLDCRMASESEFQDYTEKLNLENSEIMCDLCEKNPPLRYRNLCKSCWDLIAEEMGEYHEWNGGLTSKIRELIE